jgi:hypothetical protein
LNLLIDQGYQPVLPLSPKQQKLELWSQHAIELINPDLGVYVDLHWDLLRKPYGLSIDVDEMFNRAIEVNINEQLVKTFCPQDAVLAAALHASRECWSDIRFALDVALLLKKGGIDERELLTRARGYDLERILKISLAISYRLFAVPENDINSLDNVSTNCMGQIYRRLIEGNLCNELEDFKLQFAVRETLPAKVKYVLARFFIPHEKDWYLKLPESLFFLYFVLKPLKTLSLAAFKLSTHLIKRFS